MRAQRSSHRASRNGLPSERAVETWANALASSAPLRSAAWNFKRWSSEAIDRLSVGFDGDRFTFPVRDGSGLLVGVIRYAPPPLLGDEPKSIADRGSKRELFPAPESIAGAERWLCEGESDSVTGTAAGLPAVGVPGTAGWRKEWAPRFEGLVVVIVMDCDDPGRAAAEEIARDLAPFAAEVRILDLDPSRDDHYDLGDFLTEAEDLRAGRLALLQRVREAPIHEPPPEFWPPLPLSSPLPVFPLEELPAVMSEWVEKTAEATQTPIDLAACAALGVLSACLAGGEVVELERGWREEVSLYVVCALDSGERKSAVLRGATAELRAIERERMAAARPLVAEAETRREISEQRRRRLVAEIAKSEDPDKRAEVARLTAELAQDEPQVPRLLADDATPEALGGLLARYGRIAILAAESAFLDNLAGRYSEGRSNLHLVCQAYSGEPTTIDRRSREPEALERPLLTIALCVQPHVLATLVADPTARAQGFVARCLLARPQTLLGRRRIRPDPVPEPTSRNWAKLVKRLAEIPETLAKLRKPKTQAGLRSSRKHLRPFCGSRAKRANCCATCSRHTSRACTTKAICAARGLARPSRRPSDPDRRSPPPGVV